MRILLGMSGGVDSSAAAVLLKKDYDVMGLTLSLYSGDSVCAENTKNNIRDAAAVCKAVGIEHEVLDLSAEFGENVIDAFCRDYIDGNTPNPCINCNKYIKFGKMLEYAKQNGFDKIATGHYARIRQENGKYYLLCAADKSKDQTYVLYNLTQDILKHLLLPLGDFTKEECRKRAQSAGLPVTNKKDSQDICFVPSGDYGKFIEARVGKQNPGKFSDKSGNILGDSKALIYYTVGQRKGLGIALGHPAFVTEKNTAENKVVLGQNEDLFYKKVYIKDINFITDKIESGSKIEAKLRYGKKAANCLFISENGQTYLLFDEPQRAPTAGQAAVFYNGEICLGGGIIVKGEK